MSSGVLINVSRAVKLCVCCAAEVATTAHISHSPCGACPCSGPANKAHTVARWGVDDHFEQLLFSLSGERYISTLVVVVVVIVVVVVVSAAHLRDFAFIFLREETTCTQHVIAGGTFEGGRTATSNGRGSPSWAATIRGRGRRLRRWWARYCSPRRSPWTRPPPSSHRRCRSSNRSRTTTRPRSRRSSFAASWYRFSSSGEFFLSLMTFLWIFSSLLLFNNVISTHLNSIPINFNFKKMFFLIIFFKF